jgi:uncharacterized protein YkwD
MIGTFVILVVMAADLPTAEQPKIVEMQQVATQIRKDRGLGTQTLDEDLCKLSQKWANYMASNHTFHHGGGENIIAVGYNTPEAAFGGWLSSSGHRYWVLSNTDQCGWGAAQSSTGRWYWVGVFRNSKKKRAAITAVSGESGTTYYRPRHRLFRRRRY